MMRNGFNRQECEAHTLLLLLSYQELKAPHALSVQCLHT